MTTLKEIFQSDDWIITSFLNGFDGRIRITAKRRHSVADKPRTFSKWGSLGYVNRLFSERFGKKISNFKTK